MESKYGELAIFDVSPKEHQDFSKNVCKILDIKLGNCEVKKFDDGETDIEINDSVRGKNVFVFQSYVPPIGERKYELEQFLDAAGAGGCANRMNVIMPYLFGQRGDRQTRARQPVPAGIVAKDLMNQANSALCVDVHNKGIQTFYNLLGIRFEHLEFSYLVASLLIERLKTDDNVFIGTADGGGVKRARSLRDIVAHEYERNGKQMILPLAVADKHRPAANVAEIHAIIGDVKGKDGFIIDDIGDSLGTLKNAARAYKKEGVNKLVALLCHPVLSHKAEQNLKEIFDENLFDAIYFGNTVPLKPFVKDFDKIKIIPLEPFVAEAIRRIHLDISISGLHEYEKIMTVYGGQIKLL
ncbi:ribose-phosphate diphosphokinase [archaeon]|nr:ribose-phosphate diphosphokinase [archaeon]